MKCNQFLENLADWASERLSDDHAVRMREHAAHCASCSRDESRERRFMDGWKTMPEPSREVDIWTRVAARLEQPRKKPIFSFGFGRMATVGTLAAGALCAILFAQFNGPAPNRPGVGTRTDALTMVAAMRELPEADPDELAAGGHMRRDLFMGRDDRP